MFIEKDESEVNYEKSTKENSNSIKEQINDCLNEANKRPGMRKKILQSMASLEDQLNEIRAEEGYLAQLRAQQRLRDQIKAKKEKSEKDIENILERTAVLDSAVRAVGLQKMLVPAWNEEKNSYMIMS